MIRCITIDKLNAEIEHDIRDIDRLNYEEIPKLDYSIKLSDKVETKILNQNKGEQNNAR